MIQPISIAVHGTRSVHSVQGAVSDGKAHWSNCRKVDDTHDCSNGPVRVLVMDGKPLAEPLVIPVNSDDECADDRQMVKRKRIRPNYRMPNSRDPEYPPAA